VRHVVAFDKFILSSLCSKDKIQYEAICRILKEENNLSEYKEAGKQTELKIVNAFWTLYKKMEIGKITIRNITAESGIHRATFYRHFQDIYAVLEYIEAKLLDELKNIYMETLKSDSDMTNYLRKIYELFRKDYEYLHVLVRNQRDLEFSNKYKKYLKDKIPMFIQSEDKHAEIVIDMMITGIVEMIITWADEDILSFDEIVSILRGWSLEGFYPTLLSQYKVKILIDPNNDNFFGSTSK
jgi:AcrR family transcriptional regulator